MRCLLPTIACCLILSGCERAPEASQQMDNYLERVGRVLDASWTQFDSKSLSQYRLPSRRERLLPVAEQRIGMLELLVESRRCQTLQQSVSQRNSSLGKVMPWSHRLAADGELIQALDDCIEVLQEDPSRKALLADLQTIATTKREELPAVFWNALNAASEFEYYLRFAPSPLPVSSATLTDQAAIDALHSLTAIGQALPGELPPPRVELQSHFQALQRSQRSSELIHSLARLTDMLEQVTAMLDSERAQKLCPLGKPTQRSQILLNVFVTFYAGEIQPYLAQVQRLGQPWQQSLSKLAQVQAIPAETEHYLHALVGVEDSLWERYQQQLSAHSTAWQDVLGQCQLRPGQPGWNNRATDA
ncbi:DUF3080 family protein [Halopseudomonas sp.]|jgi:hypothetical protein|uniref:DUF3080 family protein n=1 Tax=Halopseudomonas sp. TaxID=2901191 RepID=UPI0039E3E55F